MTPRLSPGGRHRRGGLRCQCRAAGGFLRLIDSETGAVRELRVDAAVASRYRVGLQRLQGHWDDACRAAGAMFTPVVAEEMLSEWRLDRLVATGMFDVV